MPSFWLTFLSIPAFIILLILGTWQVNRLSWKTDLIKDYNNKFNDHSVKFSEISNEILNFKYRKIEVSGFFNHNQEINLIGKTYEGNAGYHIITPLTLIDGNVILINRGWVPKKYLDKKSRIFTLSDELTKVTGLIRMPQEKGYFVPQNEPQNGFWFTVKPPEILNFLKINGEKRFYIDELRFNNKIKLPIAANGRIKFPNNHLQYALTWYILGFGLLIIYFLWHHKNGFLIINRKS